MKNHFNSSLLALVLLATLNSPLSTAFAQGTAFTYQGRLHSGGMTASGQFEMSFALYDAATNGNLVGPLLTVAPLAVSNGLFTATLDFGNGVFSGGGRWLEVAVRTNGGSTFAALNPRQPITAAPYAVTAGSLSGVLPGASLSGYYGNAVNFYSAGNQFNGTYSGDGGALQNLGVNAVRLGAVLDVGVARFESLTLAGSEYINNKNQVAAGDFNGDGWPDVACLAYPDGAGTTLSVYTNNRQNGVALMWQVSTNLGGFQPLAIAVGDFNGDGRADLFRANSGINNSQPGNSISLFLGGTATMTSAGVITTSGRPVALCLADFNLDGRLDLASANTQSGQFQVFINTGSVLPSLSGSYPFPATGYANPVNAHLAAGDLNGDGRPDLVAGLTGDVSYSSARLVLLTNSGGATLTAAIDYAPASLGDFYMEMTDLRCADVDGDGQLEILFVTYDPSGNAGRILRRPANYQNVEYSIWKRLPGLASLSVVAADFNFDNRPEIVSGNQFFGNAGNGNFGLDATLPNLTYQQDLMVEADFDRDGRMDLYVAGGSQRRLLLNRAGVVTRGDFEVMDSSGNPRFTVNSQGLRFAATNGAVFSISSSNGVITGNGAGLTQLNAAQVTTGTLPDARLSGNVALRDGGNGFSGIQTITAGVLGVGTLIPQTHLHVLSASPVAILRLQSAAQPGAGRIEFLSDPQGSGSEWRPGYIQSTDNGGFTGGLSFVVNGTGFDNRLAEIEAMRIVNGRVGIGTATPVSALQVVGTVTATAFNPPSDRNLKENFAPVSPRDVLAKVAVLPISSWNFKGDAATPHVGPMAQDFYAAFGLGTDDKHIATVDADGVALAAIQGLNQKLTEELEQKGTEITELKQRLEALENIVRNQKSN